VLRGGEWVGHRLHDVRSIIAFINDHTTASDHEVFVAIRNKVLNLRNKLITLELLRKVEVFEILAAQALHEGLILELEALELSTYGSLALDGVFCIALEAFAFLFKFLTLRNINLIVLMHSIDFMYVILRLLFHFKE
jgi:hypothetical protein